MSDSDDQKLADEWAAALNAQQTGEEATGGAAPAEQAEVEAFSEDASSQNKAPLSREERRKLDAIMDIPVTITMEVGHAKISIRNLLQLNQGSVIELERLAGEPLDVLVNGTLIAHGEVVVVNDKFGIRDRKSVV